MQTLEDARIWIAIKGSGWTPSESSYRFKEAIKKDFHVSAYKVDKVAMNNGLYGFVYPSSFDILPDERKLRLVEKLHLKYPDADGKPLSFLINHIDDIRNPLFSFMDDDGLSEAQEGDKTMNLLHKIGEALCDYPSLVAERNRLMDEKAEMARELAEMAGELEQAHKRNRELRGYLARQLEETNQLIEYQKQQ